MELVRKFKNTDVDVIIMIHEFFFFFLRVNLTTRLHLVPRLRMRGAVPPLPQYVFMEWCLKQEIRFHGIVFS
jgi:hypothetical protein